MEPQQSSGKLPLEALRQVGLEITAQLDLDRLLQSIVERATELLQGTAGGLHIYHPEEDVLEWTVATGSSRAPLGTILKRGEGVAGHVLDTNQLLLLGKEQHLSSKHPFPLVSPNRSIVAVPIRWEPQFLGVLHVLAELPRDFSEDDASLLSMFATHAAIAIQNAQLVHRLRESEESLRQQADELQARNEELDAFAHTVAHDLKAPLVNLLVFAQILDEDYGTLSQEEITQGTQTITRNVRKVNNIIEGLLLLASIRKVEAISELLDMGSIVKEACFRLADAIAAQNTEIVLPSSWPVAVGYSPWVEEVWFNYISNALKYGGQPLQIKIGASPEKDMIRFWVQDNGPGLTPRQQTQLFVPFTQLGQVGTKGHGLGLSIVRRIVEKLGGEVGVESEAIPGQGSRFYFTLPKDQEFGKA